MSITDLKQFTDINKPITYIKAFVELYNKRNYGQVYEIYRIVEFEKWCNLTLQYLCNFNTFCIVEISSILHSAFITLRNQKKIIFYMNNFIHGD